VIDTLTGRFASERLVVRLDTTLAEARRRIPRVMAALDETGDGVMMTCNTGSLEWTAAFLATLPWTVKIVQPPELVAAVERLATRAHDLYARATHAGDGDARGGVSARSRPSRNQSG
jgi:predicted DNA-binding transcriptional regulator YafY